MGCLALGEIGVGLGVGSGTGCLREELGWVRVGLGWVRCGVRGGVGNGVMSMLG